MASTYITNGLTAGSGTIGTVSLWVKRAALGTSTLYHFFEDNVTFCRLRFDSSDVLHCETYDNNTSNGKFKTNRVFRDTSAWYHIVVRVDTTQSTEADRFKLYVNGSEETSFSTSNYPTQNRDVKMTAQPYIGTEWQGSGVNYFDGCMAHVIYTDGQSYAASTFGSTDATTGEWKINTSQSVTYGSKGFFVLKDANGVTDQSGNSNNFTVGGGTLTTLQDNPSNNFSTLSPIIRTSGGAFSQVANTFTDTSGSYQTGFSSQGMLNGQGKYYAEFKVVSGSSLIFGIADYKDGGIIDRIQQGQTRYLGEYSNAYGYQSSGRFYYNGSSTTTDYTSFTTNDIIGLAVDMDNLKIYWHKNGTYQGAADPASNNGYTIVAPEEAYHMGISSASSVANANFGNGIFGTTAISSEGTNASGEGKFEYDVPSGYTALCTKGLNL